MKRTIKVFLGEMPRPVGTLLFNTDGNREAAAFSYDEAWLAHPERFQIDPALPLVTGPQYHAKGKYDHASVYHGCFSDSEPDGWGIRVIRRDHAKSRKEAERAGQPISDQPLNSLDCLLYVDDASRIGALRFQDEAGKFVRTPPRDGRTAPPLIELSALLNASRAVENNTETAADLRYLLGKGTSVGGMRPKCTVIDDDGALSIGKFPSDTDTRPVTKGEVLALRLARAAGIAAAEARVVYVDGVPVTLVRRFDRFEGKRLMYASARTMLGLDDGQEHAYTEMVDVLRQQGVAPERDCEEMWRRLVFNILVTNVDDHLNNHGFLHISCGKWRLSPAFDINPFPDKARVLKTWISEDTGPDASIDAAMKVAPYFGLRAGRAREVLENVAKAVDGWRRVAGSPEIGMTADEIDQFAPAFDHDERLVVDRALRVRGVKSAPLPPDADETLGQTTAGPPPPPSDVVDRLRFTARTIPAAKTAAIRVAKVFGATPFHGEPWEFDGERFSRRGYRGDLSGEIVFGAATGGDWWVGWRATSE